MPKLLVLVNLACSLYMTGLIWFVQVVHYPLFAQVGAVEFPGYEAGHSFRTTIVVAPVMLLELLVSVLLVVYAPAGMERWVVWAAAGMTAVVCASTFFVQVPLHEQLAAAFVREAQEWLARSNWIRTIGWTVRSGLLLWAVYRS